MLDNLIRAGKPRTAMDVGMYFGEPVRSYFASTSEIEAIGQEFLDALMGHGVIEEAGANRVGKMRYRPTEKGFANSRRRAGLR